MIVKVKFEYDNDVDYIYCKNTKIEVESFIKWISEDKSHPFWEFDGEEYGVNFRADAIVYWLNKYKNDNAYIIESNTDKKLNHDLLIIL